MRHLSEEDMERLEAFLDLKILRTLEALVAAIDDLNAAVAKLSTDVDALIALQQQGDQTPAITAATDAVNAVDAKITPITEPAPAG